MPRAEPSPIVLTIGHSTRTLEEFIGLLQAHGATRVVDVRTVPRSRHNPQFDEASLPGQSLDELVQLANQERIVLMCAEAVPWRCHRSLIADALLVRGIRIEDIMGTNRRQVHTLTPFAHVRGSTITYPAETARTTPKKPPTKRSL